MAEICGSFTVYTSSLVALFNAAALVVFSHFVGRGWEEYTIAALGF